MNEEEELENKIKQFKQMGEKDKDIDVAALAMNAIQTQTQNKVTAKQKKWAYLISVAFPPFGLLFALKYYFSDKSDARRVANICVILTVVLIIFYWLTVKAIFSGAGVDLRQLEQIQPGDLQELLQ